MRLGQRRRWRKGGVLCSQEETSRWIAVLLSGVVKSSVYTEDGGEVLLGLHGLLVLAEEYGHADERGLMIPLPLTQNELASTSARREGAITPRPRSGKYLVAWLPAG